jgi:hypothetical protein
MKHFIRFLALFTAIIFLAFAAERILLLIVLHDVLKKHNIDLITVSHAFDIIIVITVFVVLFLKVRAKAEKADVSVIYSLRRDFRRLFRLPPPR